VQNVKVGVLGSVGLAMLFTPSLHWFKKSKVHLILFGV
jgi:hypothetical protein